MRRSIKLVFLVFLLPISTLAAQQAFKFSLVELENKSRWVLGFLTSKLYRDSSLEIKESHKIKKLFVLPESAISKINLRDEIGQPDIHLPAKKLYAVKKDDIAVKYQEKPKPHGAHKAVYAIFSQNGLPRKREAFPTTKPSRLGSFPRNKSKLGWQLFKSDPKRVLARSVSMIVRKKRHSKNSKITNQELIYKALWSAANPDKDKKGQFKKAVQKAMRGKNPPESNSCLRFVSDPEIVNKVKSELQGRLSA